jgi:hypothetical protein
VGVLAQSTISEAPSYIKPSRILKRALDAPCQSWAAAPMAAAVAPEVLVTTEGHAELLVMPQGRGRGFNCCRHRLCLKINSL